MTKPVAIGIDIGGTRLRAAALAQDGTVLERFASPTPASDETLLVDAIAAVANRLGKDLPIGVGIAGIVTSDGVLRYGTNILVRDVPLAAHIRTLTNGEVVVANDASVAAFGEQRAGAGAGYRDVVMFTLGTGVGGGIVLGDNLMLGSSGYGAELGPCRGQRRRSPVPVREPWLHRGVRLRQCVRCDCTRASGRI